MAQQAQDEVVRHLMQLFQKDATLLAAYNANPAAFLSQHPFILSRLPPANAPRSPAPRSPAEHTPPPRTPAPGPLQPPPPPSHPPTPPSTPLPVPLSIVKVSPFDSDSDGGDLGRGKGFQVEEDERLCRCWIQVTNDSIVGTGQKSTDFWNRVEGLYNSSGARTKKSLQNRFGVISRAVNKFVGCHRRASREKPSGTDKDWVTKEALSLYRAQEHSAFTILHCYHILKDCPK